MNDTAQYPILSLKERDRRWRRTRDFLTAQGLDGLVVAGLTGREQYDAYLTNDYAEGIVVFQTNGEPTYITWQEGRITRRDTAAERGIIPWMEDMRVGVDVSTVVAVIREKGLDRSRLGVVGLESKGPAEMNGSIPYNLWAGILAELPHAKFVDCSQRFAGLMLVKSEEELVLMRYSADAGEEACRIMLEKARPGVTELELTAEILYVIFKAGAFSPPPFLILHSGPTSIAWGPPIWRYQGGTSRELEKGDIVLAEIFPRYGGFESQQQMAVALEPVDDIHRTCAQTARRCYEVGLEALRPGSSFQEVLNKMEAVIREAGAWHITPLIHSLSPLAWVGSVDASKRGDKGKGAWDSQDLKIEAGMVFELEPNAHRGNHRVNIGGTVVVTETGAEELNHLPTRMHIVD